MSAVKRIVIDQSCVPACIMQLDDIGTYLIGGLLISPFDSKESAEDCLVRELGATAALGGLWALEDGRTVAVIETLNPLNIDRETVKLL